ncbi:MAG: cation:proton antiporter [archaeon]
MDILLSLAMLLFAAKIGGFISKKIGQSAVLGEIVAGVIIGPSAFGLFTYTEFFSTFSELGIVFLMFLVGLELNIKSFEHFLKRGALIALVGAFLPYLVGIAVASLLFHWSALQSFLFGVILMASSVTITAAILRDLKKLKSPIGLTILDAAVVDDVIGITMLTFLLAVTKATTFSIIDFGGIMLKVLVFFIGVFLAGPQLAKYVIALGEHLDLRVEEGHLSVIIILILTLAILANAIGLSIVVGAFLAGMILDKRRVKAAGHEIYSMAYGLFVPVFFVLIGSYVVVGTLLSNLPLIFLIVAIAIITKLVGAGLGARLSKMNWRQSLIIGVGMIPRCEVALILALMGTTLHIIDTEIYSVLVTAIVLTAIVTPILLKAVMRD